MKPEMIKFHEFQGFNHKLGIDRESEREREIKRDIHTLLPFGCAEVN